ncbi:hypothetical protein YC2023_072845 [Brassica napus]
MSSSSNPKSSYGTGNSHDLVSNEVLGVFLGCLIEFGLSSHEHKLEPQERKRKRDKNHLFKWTDEAAVEEIEDMKSLFDEKFGHFELQNQRCEDLIKSYDKKIEDLTDALTGFGNEIKEMKELVHGYEKDVKTLKKMVICGVGMMIGYYYFAM